METGHKPVKKLTRPYHGRKLAGVCAGIADYTGIDVTIIRLAFVLLSLPGGLPGILPYLICWVVIPSSRD